MHHHRQQQGVRRIEQKLRTFEREARPVVLPERRQGLFHHVADRDRDPALLREKIVRIGKRVQTRDEGGAFLPGRRAEGLRRDRLHGAERVLDAVLDLVEQKLARLLGALAVRDVACDLGGADDLAFHVADRRNGQRDVHIAAVLALAHRLVVVDAVAAPDALQDAGLLVQPLRRDQDDDGPADDLLRPVPEQPLCARVPAGDHAVQVLADDRVVGGGDDGGEMRGRIRNDRDRLLGRNRRSGQIVDVQFPPAKDIAGHSRGRLAGRYRGECCSRRGTIVAAWRWPDLAPHARTHPAPPALSTNHLNHLRYEIEHSTRYPCRAPRGGRVACAHGDRRCVGRGRLADRRGRQRRGSGRLSRIGAAA